MSEETARGYRNAIERPPTPLAPTGELLALTAADETALKTELDRVRVRARTSAGGMLVGAVILYRIAAAMPLLESPYLLGGAVLVVGGLAVYGLVRLISSLGIVWPCEIGQLILRLSPGSQVVAGLRLDVTLLIRPKARLMLDPLIVRLVALRTGGGSEEVAYETVHRLAERQVVEAAQGVRLETCIRIPEDAPATSLKRRIHWRLEVTIGKPVIFRRSRVVHVRPLTRRRKTSAAPA